MSIDDLLMPQDALVRALGVARGVQNALFLGAGASTSSGIPSAEMCIWEWKRAIFLTNNVGLERQFAELSLPSVKDRIQAWLDRQGVYPRRGSREEYSAFIEACYPLEQSRRDYFRAKVLTARPHVGYRLLGLMAEVGIFDTVLTTNFDNLVSRAAAECAVTPIEVGIDSQQRLGARRGQAEIRIIALHGDYRYDRLKNTDAELQEKEARLEAALRQRLNSGPVIVCGYSGRDDTVMAAFDSSISSASAAPIYWCARTVSDVSPSVSALLRKARSQRGQSHLILIDSFDDLMVRLSHHCLSGTQLSRAQSFVVASHDPTADRAAFRVTTDLAAGTILKSNAFPIDCPDEVLSFEPTAFPVSGVWKWVRDQTANRSLVAVPFKGRVIAIGELSDLRSAFEGKMKTGIERSPVDGREWRHEDGAIVSLMRSALVRGLSSACQLATDGKYEIWEPRPTAQDEIDGARYDICESVGLFLREIDGKRVLILKPSLRVIDSKGEAAPHEVATKVKIERLGWQHNKEFNVAVEQWRRRLFGSGDDVTTVHAPHRGAIDFMFRVRRVPLFASVTSPTLGRAARLAPEHARLVTQRGIQVAEPMLRVSNREGNGEVHVVHPVRGILTHRPYDYALTHRGMASQVRLGIVCPAPEARILRAFVERLQSRLSAGRYEADYLPDFPGFQSAFGIPLEIPNVTDAGWVTCGEPDQAGSTQARSVDVARRISRAIDELRVSVAPSAVLILFPERWKLYRGYETPDERFDVHDYVKSASAQRGVGTQFLDQSTLVDPMQCRVAWWLSLAFYVKAMRTPWVLEGLDPDSAFVGIGMAISRSSSPRHVVLGCSHIYSPRGEGLSYRVTQIDDPVFFGRNPFLSRLDARRVGTQIRELFYEASGRLPKRVVLHKRTRFTADERMGLREGLEGVEEVDMIEIIIDDALRYIASTIRPDGRIEQDSYPVGRGTAIRLDDYSALVWIHGVTNTINSGRRYYQGKRRIPAPLLIRRHAGRSDLPTLARELVGLSKMNWNTFDLYTKLPATIQSSNEIARIGAMTRQFSGRSIDFRLLI